MNSRVEADDVISRAEIDHVISSFPLTCFLIDLGEFRGRFEHAQLLGSEAPYTDTAVLKSTGQQARVFRYANGV